MNVFDEVKAQQQGGGGGFGQPPGGYGPPPGGGGGFGQPPGGGGFGPPPGGGGFGPPPGGQPPGGFGAPPPGGGGFGGPPPVGPAPDAAERLKLPFIAMIAYAGIGAALALLSLVSAATNASLMPGLGGDDQLAFMFSGALGVVSAIIQLAVCGLIVFGALQMKNLQKWPLALAAAIVAAVPCITPCCCLGTPVGAWVIFLLVKPEIKAAFRG